MKKILLFVCLSFSLNAFSQEATTAIIKSYAFKILDIPTNYSGLFETTSLSSLILKQTKI